MNRRETAEEPSMEEILASIRKIIADDPAQDAATDARLLPRLSFPPRDTPPRKVASETGALTVPGASGNGAAPTRLALRLNDAFGSGSAPGRKPHTPIAHAVDDDGLDDLLDDPPPARPVPSLQAPELALR